MYNTTHVRREIDKRTSLPFDYYQGKAGSKNPYLIINGMGVTPPDINNFSNLGRLKKSAYNGLFPHLLREISGEDVGVFYQAGACKGKFRRGYYSEDTDELLRIATLAFIDGRDGYYITHSLSSKIGINLALEGIPGTISSVVDTAKDCLTDEKGHKRTLLGIPFLGLFQVAQYLPKSIPALPIYPLARQDDHDGDKETEKVGAWGADRFVMTASARYVLGINTYDKVSNSMLPGKKPLFIITKEDKICSPFRQQEIADSFKAEKIEMDAGHRWFTEDEGKLVEVIGMIIEHRKKNQSS